MHIATMRASPDKKLYFDAICDIVNIFVQSLHTEKSINSILRRSMKSEMSLYPFFRMYFLAAATDSIPNRS